MNMTLLLLLFIALAYFAGILTHWMYSSKDRRELRTYRQYARQMNELDRQRQHLEQQRRHLGGNP